MFNSARALLMAPHPREIYVTVRDEDKQCVIRVSDSAAAIDVPEGMIADDGTIDMQALVEKSASQSSGLGLRIASDLMQALGGSLTLRRDDETVVAFFISFPQEIDNRNFHGYAEGPQ